MRSWVCAQIENEEEEESWQEGGPNGRAVGGGAKIGRNRGKKMDRRKFLKFGCHAKVLELVVNERTSQGKRVESPKDKTKVPGRSVEEMKEKPNITVEDDTEEMRKWRGLSQSEMDQCWWHSADRMEEEVLDKYKVEECKREAFGGRGDTFWKGGECAKTRNTN